MRLLFGYKGEILGFAPHIFRCLFAEEEELTEGGFEIAAGAGLLAADEFEVVVVGVEVLFGGGEAYGRGRVSEFGVDGVASAGEGDFEGSGFGGEGAAVADVGEGDVFEAGEFVVVVGGVNFDEVIEGELNGGGIFGGKAGGFGVIAVFERVEASERGVAGAGGFGSVGAGGGGLGRGARSFGRVGVHSRCEAVCGVFLTCLRPEASTMGGRIRTGVEGSD